MTIYTAVCCSIQPYHAENLAIFWQSFLGKNTQDFHIDVKYTAVFRAGRLGTAGLHVFEHRMN